MPKPLPKSPYLNERFASAVTEFGMQFKNTASISNPSNRGTAREQKLRNFFSDRLPKKFSVVEGEAVDLRGNSSQQFDLVIYDSTQNFAFSSDGITILPAEAVLATIEIKSVLNPAKLAECVSSARKLRNLSPFDRKLGGLDVGNSADNKVKLSRFFHCVFAYASNLKEPSWGAGELGRITKLIGDEHLIDMMYVVDRGILNIPGRLYRLEDDQGGAISSFYFSILNFVMREAARRSPAPFDRYITHNPNSWTKL